MIEEVSAGGIVVFGNSILLLRKFNGDYVLPKGRVEKNESINNAAVREVFEESGSRVNIVKYLDKITYEFIRNSKSEGFVSVSFFPFDRAIQLARYDDERRILKKAVEDISFYE